MSAIFNCQSKNLVTGYYSAQIYQVIFQWGPCVLTFWKKIKKRKNNSAFAHFLKYLSKISAIFKWAIKEENEVLS